MSVLRFSRLLACCLFVLCQSVGSSSADDGLSHSDPSGRYRRSSGRAGKSALTEPGIIVGIIVGVSGVLVVIGVALFLCRLFCCKEASCTCCPCCKEKETYLEAGTVPIKIPSQDNLPENNTPLSTMSQNRPGHARPWQGARKGPGSTSPNGLPQYDDVDWKRGNRGTSDDLTEEKQAWEPDAERQSSPYSRRRSAENSLDPPANNGDEIPNSQLLSGGKRKEKTPTRRKLTYGADNSDAFQNSADFIPLDHEPEKRNNTEAARNGRQLPVTSHKPGKRRLQASYDEDRDTTVMERNPQREVADGREFPLLEYEPRKRNFSPSYPADTARPWEETGRADREFRPVEYTHQLQISHTSFPDDTHEPWEGSPGDADFRPTEHGHQPQVRQPPRPVPRSRMWGGEDGERRPGWDHREILAARAPFPSGTVVQPAGGRDNMAFNQDSTETSV